MDLVITNAISMFRYYISYFPLHRQSSKIGITHVNKALKKRFWSEEIARMGNKHIIYPALRKQDFIAIIKKEIERLKEQIEKKRAFRWKRLLRLKPLIA